MRQRASTKTQRRLKQQQRDPYALTDDVYCEAPTFRVGGLVTAVGVLQLVAAMVLGGFVFGGALLFCVVLLAALGSALLHHSDPKATKKGLGLKQAINSLLALRRSALDYTLTLSIAQSQEYQQQKKELEIAVVPTSPTPQKVVATMALKPEETVKIKQKKKPTPLAVNAPVVTLNPLDMKLLPTMNPHSAEATEDLFMEKPRANSEPKQVLRTRPLLPLKPKMQQQAPVQEKKKKTQEKMVPVLPKTLEKQEKKTQQTKTKPQPQKKSEPKAPKVVPKKEVQVPPVLLKAEPKVVIPVVLPKAEPVELPKPKPVEVVPPTATVVVEPIAPVETSLPVFPAVKPLVAVARGEPAMEQELVVTRKVLLYLSAEGESVMDLREQELEQDIESEHELEFEHEPEDCALSMEAFPPLSPTMTPQEPMPLPATDVLEPNFLMDIELEPISKPEKKLISLSSLSLEQVGNADLRLMLDELDAMQSELDAAMARCTSLLNGEEVKASTSSKLELQPEEEPIFCC
ncbi:hypothetical protein PI124_g9636 [Phytophthora idaei]|nr:hypothetical protein PI125_g7010 [Phytophthora idaei]KAG3161142.1 hypothetical protein PI126_g6580 [Phytophthora idaei]KAG3245627.1 hypothetical protein PI124_g9636 [Phytophthora idaei]